MKVSELAKKIAVNEEGKSQVKIGNIKEILKFIAIVLSDDEETLKEFLKYGAKKSKELGNGKKQIFDSEIYEEVYS